MSGRVGTCVSACMTSGGDMGDKNREMSGKGYRGVVQTTFLGGKRVTRGSLKGEYGPEISTGRPL